MQTIALLFASTTLLIAQVVPAPKIEAASIKPCKSGNYGDGRGGNNGGPSIAGGGFGRWSPGRLDIDCATVRGLIMQAYILFPEGRRQPVWVSRTALEGGPAWVKSDQFDIHVKVEGASNEPMMRGPVLQQLLAERFQLKIRRAVREVPVYELRVAKGGHKLKRFVEGSCNVVDFANDTSDSDPKACPAVTRTFGVNVVHEARGMDLEAFCQFMLFGQDRPVVDKTGLVGRFDFEFQYTPEEGSGFYRPDGSDPATIRGQSLFSALRQQLGLDLVPAKGSAEYFVIDNVERPSEN